jgi:hypothetical protein
VPDLDGDGRSEVAVVAVSRFIRLLSFDAQSRSFRTLHTLRAHCGYGYIDDFGTSIDVLQDVDGDGKADLVIGANESWAPGFFDDGYAEVWSGGSGSRIALLASSKTQGMDACSLDDVDGDRIPDVALSLITRMPVEAWGSTQIVRVVSAKDGSKVVWERTIASLRGMPAAKKK